MGKSKIKPSSLPLGTCKWCKGDNTIKRGKQFQCKDCGKYTRIDGYEPPDPTEEKLDIEYGRDYIRVVTTSPRIKSAEDAIKEFAINMKEWEIAPPIRVKSHEGYRKDRKSSWHVENGKTIRGDVEDTGNMLLVTLYSVDVRFVRKTQEIRATNVVQEIILDAKKHSIKVPKINYPKSKDGVLLELAIFDAHFGRLCWGEESGADFDVHIAEKLLKQTLMELLDYSKNFNISKILIPFGGDYFNSNSKANSTVLGTAQQEDTRYSKTFRLGRKLAIDIIDRCYQIAPVDVVLVKGNHDEERLFYLGDSLECWYHNNKNVDIDNSPKSRKYYSFGKTLLGFTHGDDVKLEKLPMLMALEAPRQWLKSKYREIHTGDKHHRLTLSENGVVIRILGSIVAPDQWTYNKGFVGPIRATESFVFHPEKGLVAQFTSTVR